jgi:uncharacterized membrane protein
MNKPLRIGISILVALILGGLIWSLLGPLIALGLKIALIAAIGLIVYGLLTRKSLGGGRSRWLP